MLAILHVIDNEHVWFNEGWNPSYDYLQDRWKTQGHQVKLFFYTLGFKNLKPSPEFLIPTMIISRIGGRMKEISLNSFSILRRLIILYKKFGYFIHNRE